MRKPRFRKIKSVKVLINYKPRIYMNLTPNFYSISSKELINDEAELRHPEDQMRGVKMGSNGRRRWSIKGMRIGKPQRGQNCKS